MTASVRDVAQRAGVSISTASRALNNKPDVNKDVRLPRPTAACGAELHRQCARPCVSAASAVEPSA